MLPNLTAPDFTAALQKLDACLDARTWAEGKDFATAWATCRRGDWLLWLLEAAAPLDAKTNELLVCRFAREVTYLNPDPGVLACIQVREAWARGEATSAERDAARDAVKATATAADLPASRDAAGATAPYAARATASYAARAAAGDAARAAAGDAASDCAWDAARAAARGAAGSAAGSAAQDAAWASAWDAAGAKQANIIREVVPMPLIAQSL